MTGDRFLIDFHEPFPLHQEPRGMKRVAVGPLSPADVRGDGLSDPLARVRGLFVAALRAIMEAGAGPHMLERVVLSVSAIEPLKGDIQPLELLFREVFGGNICDLFIEEGDDTVMATALMPIAMSNDPVWNGLSAREVSLEYSARAAVPEHMDIFAEWRRKGQAFLTKRTAEIPYGPSSFNRIDLFMPERAHEQGIPLHVFIHGGYWQAMDKADHGWVLQPLLDAGVAVAAVNYDLCPSVTVEKIVDQVRQAIITLSDCTGEFGYNGSAIHVSGHSAGGQLGAVMLATDWSAMDPSLPTCLVKSGVLVSGVYELEPLRHTAMQRALRLDSEMARRISPVFMKPGPGIKAVIAVGGNESGEFLRQSASMASAWRVQGADVEEIGLPGRNHFTALEAMSEKDNPLCAAAISLALAESK